MKKIVSLLILICVSYTLSYSQTTYLGGPNSTIEIKGGCKVDSAFQLPIVDTSKIFSSKGTNSTYGVIVINSADSNLCILKNGHYQEIADGGITDVTSPNSTLTIGASGTTKTADINLTHRNAWTVQQEFDNDVVFGGTAGAKLILKDTSGTKSITFGIPGNLTSSYQLIPPLSPFTALNSVWSIASSGVATWQPTTVVSWDTTAYAPAAADTFRTLTVGSSVTAYEVIAEATVYSYSSGNPTIHVSFTDDHNAPRNISLSFSTNDATPASIVYAAIGGTGSFSSMPKYIKCKASSTIYIYMDAITTATGNYFLRLIQR